MILDLAEVAGRRVLAGTPFGRSIYDRLWTATARCVTDQSLLLDFGNVEAATSSFLREAVVRFRHRTREERPHLYPIAVNMLPEVEEELAGILEIVGEAMWAFDLSGEGVADRRRLVGRLDPKLKETLRLLERRGSTRASLLWQNQKDGEKIGVTAWNNRLANLSRQGLVVENSYGRTKTYAKLEILVS
jgi:hypothetical protein